MAGSLVTTINHLGRLLREIRREGISREERQLLDAILLRNKRDVTNLGPEDAQDPADPGTDEQPPKPAGKVCQ